MSSPFATGGSITLIDVDGVPHYIHTFDVGASTFEITHADGLSVEYLVVAGGGQGGGWQDSRGQGGGGGAGGVLTGTLPLAQGFHSVVVGAGAPGVGSNVIPSGDNSLFGGLTAYGGGSGAAAMGGFGMPGRDGGSGGGATAGQRSPGDGTPGQGHDGGWGPNGWLRHTNGSPAGGSSPEDDFSGAGGGGAGSPGHDTASGGHGGDGILSDITGTPQYYGGGGGGCGIDLFVNGPDYPAGVCPAPLPPGLGGLGGGGNGGTENAAPTPGVNGTGGGGGGYHYFGTFYDDSAGGDGIVILRYPDPAFVVIETDVVITAPPALLGLHGRLRAVASVRGIRPGRLNLRNNRLYARLRLDWRGAGVAGGYALTGEAGLDWSLTGRAYSDFSAMLAREGGGYLLEIASASSPPLRLPISSWQATLKRLGAAYVQCVVPAAAEHLAPVMARYAQGARFTILRQSATRSGAPFEQPMASAPLGSPVYNGALMRASLMLSGYEEQDYGDAPIVRQVHGVRSLSQTATTQRVRCAIDWILRPGMVAQGDGWSFVVDWIGYSVNIDDEYMDVGGES